MRVFVGMSYQYMQGDQSTNLILHIRINISKLDIENSLKFCKSPFLFFAITTLCNRAKAGELMYMVSDYIGP